MTADTAILAPWIIPVEPDDRVLEDHALLIRDGRIVDLVARSRLDGYTVHERVELADHALIPGLVNAHGHAAMTLFRGLADDLPMMHWLTEHIWPAEGRWIDEAFVRDGTRLAVAEMLRGGTTCFNDMYFFPDATAAVAAEAGMRAVVGLIMVDMPTAWARDADEYLSKGTALHDRLRDEPLVHTAFSPHAPYSVSDGPLERIRVLAEELDIPIHMHVHESPEELAHSLKHYGCRPLERLERLGLLTPRLMAVHMTHLEPDEIARVANCGASVVHCPESNLKLASGFCPVHALAAAGVNLALGTDGAASNNDLDMFAEMRTAALLAKGVAGDPTALPAHAALRMATLAGARALGLEDITGSLIAGKAADVTAVHLGAVETQPVYSPVSQLVYAAGRHQVSDVWVAGRRVLKDRLLTTLDTRDAIVKAAAWRDKIHTFDAKEPQSA
ncbi:MAG: TRZ/ATZ family hydrolase [Gammaproteobacteria bacterium]|nr:TRZ/ATZ family hydrolase [Gammaproteobacteria bacterium]